MSGDVPLPQLDERLTALQHSAFRCKFHLPASEMAYLHRKGPVLIAQHARDFIAKRLAPAVIANDGKQTPFRGHPVFIAQHATATCCRACLAKWHHIPPGRVMAVREVDYVVALLLRWLEREITKRP